LATSHNLAIELQHQAQYAVRRRVLRSEIDGEVAQLSLVHGGPPFGAPYRSGRSSDWIKVKNLDRPAMQCEREGRW
jgi:ATP-dependent DNA ligase